MEPWNARTPVTMADWWAQRARRSLARKTRLARHGRELRALRESALHLRWPATAATLPQSVFQCPSTAAQNEHAKTSHVASPLVRERITEDLSGACGILGADPLTVEAAVEDQRVRIHERARASGRCIQRKRRCSQ